MSDKKSAKKTGRKAKKAGPPQTTTEQLLSAIREHGSVSEAARQLKMSRATFNRRLYDAGVRNPAETVWGKVGDASETPAAQKAENAPEAPRRTRKPARMGLSDLRLLSLVLHENMHGQCDVGIPPGFTKAAERLCRAGLIARLGSVCLPTRDGEAIGDLLVHHLQECLEEAMATKGEARV